MLHITQDAAARFVLAIWRFAEAQTKGRCRRRRNRVFPQMALLWRQLARDPQQQAARVGFGIAVTVNA